MRPMPELKVTMAKTEELVPYVGNAKLHPAEQVDQIAASIEEFGNNDPIAVWHNDDGELEIIEGHGRLMALKKLGIEECPVITLDHMTDEQRRAYMLVHNQLTMNSGYDDALLDNELMGIDIDMSQFGFDYLVEEALEGVEGSKDEQGAYTLASMELKAFESYDYLVFVFTNTFDWLAMLQKFNVEKVDFGYNGVKKIGLGRVINGQKLIEQLGDTPADTEQGQGQLDND